MIHKITFFILIIFSLCCGNNCIIQKFSQSAYITSSSQVVSSDNIIWSILICTLESRRFLFEKLYNKLLKQINECNVDNKVEILFFSDEREFSIGFKRNTLLKLSSGKYVNFLDDDDDVHNNYISLIYEKLKNNPDCISLNGLIYRSEKDQRLFIHSIKYDHYFEQDKIYYRPPNHLNTMRRNIAIQFEFPPINCGEDTQWAMQIAKSQLLKVEETIEEPYYFYFPHESRLKIKNDY